MTRFHINPATGNPGACSASMGNCPFGEAADHYPSLEEARTAFEVAMQSLAIPTLNRVAPAETVLQTIHGSHLYGMAKPTSDLDYYRVIENVSEREHAPGRQVSNKTKQQIAGEDDVLEIPLTPFLMKCDEGVPQALEAMFSPFAQAGDFEDFRRAYRINTARVAVTYRRTVMNFARLGLENTEAVELLTPSEDEISKKRVRESVRVKKPRRVARNGLLKYRRHALRLMLNRETAIEYGMFNPHLTDSARDFVLTKADLDDMAYAQLVHSRIE